MWQIKDVVVFGILCLFSYIDIKKRRVPVLLLGVCGAAVFLYQIFRGYRFVWETAGGAGVGAVFTDQYDNGRKDGLWGQLGDLNSWGLSGNPQTGGVVEYLFFLLALTAVVILSIRKMAVGTGIPFFPFLACGYLIMLVCQEA